MLRILFFMSFFILVLYARENPFFPSKGEKDITITSNVKITIPPLKRATITLPSRARLLKSVTVEYANLDGSVEKKTIKLDNTIDWHLPIFISQNYSSSAVCTKNVSLKKPKKIRFKRVMYLKYIQLYTSKKYLKMITKDKMIRNLMLVRPHRVVFDFKRDANFRSYVKKNPNSVFKKFRIGNHNGYYRVVVELDGYYRYKVKKISKGYLLTLF